MGLSSRLPSRFLARCRQLTITATAAVVITGCSTAGGSRNGPVLTLAIVGTNDLHGTLQPEIIETKEVTGGSPTRYLLGGASTLAAYIDILRAEYDDRLLWLDAGDEFQGALESNIEEGASVVRFFNQAGLSAATIGNHEFDFGPGLHGDTDPRGVLKTRIREARYPVVSANIVERSSGKDALPIPRSILITTAGVRVGVLGLTTATTGVTTWPPFVSDLQFTNLAEATLREARRLRERGAEVIVLLAHVGVACESADLSTRIVSERDPQSRCSSDDELPRFLRSLPPGTVDAVVSGHSHSVVHHWMSGVPVVQGEWKGHYLNVIYLPFDPVARKVLREQIRIEGPVRVCTSVFSGQGDCDGNRPAPPNGRGALIPASFHGHRIVPNRRVAAILTRTFQRVAALKARVIAQAARPLRLAHATEAEMGNLVTDAMRAKTAADVAILNAGGIRAALPSGPITYGDVFAALPFDNRIVILHVNGRELRLLLRVAESGALGYFPVSGVRMTLSDCGASCPGDDLDANGQIEPWERDHLVRTEMNDGSALDEGRVYRLATNDFIVAGGDFMNWPVSRVPSDRREVTGLLIRDAVLEYLERLGSVNTTDRPLVVPGAPRLAFVPPGAPREELR